MYLLRKIKNRHEESSAYGSYIQPGTVLRCDGTDRKNPEQPDLSAIFVSFPYFDMGKWKPPDAPKDDSLHLPRGLFQCLYTQEVALDREGDQMFRKFKGVKADQYLRVPQLWALILESKTIITCGPSTLVDLFSEDIEFVDEDSLPANERLIHVTDPWRRVTYLPLDQCRTFLGLRQSIEKKCLTGTDCKIDECILHSGSSEEELLSNQWVELLEAERSVFIYVRISRKAPAAKPKKKEAIEGPVQNRMIEYAGISSGESSDDSSDKRNKMALIRIKKR